MEKALYPIYVYWTTSTPTNSFENCEFCYNTQNGIKISSSSAHIKSCNIHHNSYYGINSYNSPQIDVEGTHIHHNNRHGVFSQTGCHLKFYGSVIEYNGTSSSYHGVRTRNYDHFEFGQPDVELDDWKGYNTIRENTGIEIQVYNGSPNVDLYYSSIYDDSGLEVYNYSGNQAVEADYCYWGSDEECDHSGSVEVGTIIPDIEDAWWTGNLYTGGLGKVLVYENSSGVQSKESRIEELKAIIESDPSSLEAEHALVELYFIIRDDYVSDKLGEKQVFYDFLKDIDLNHGDKKIVKKALSFMIFWKMLEHDNVEVIKLSKKALEKLDGDDHMFVLEDLAITYAYVGYIQKARKCLVEIKEKYAFDEEGIEFVEEAIAEAEEMVRIGELLAKELTDEFEMILDTFTLLQNYPNPGNPTTNIIFSLAEPRRVELRIFNILGQEVRSLVNDYREAGAYSVIWNGKNNQGMEVPSGIYLYRLRAGDHVFVKKLTLLK